MNIKRILSTILFCTVATLGYGQTSDTTAKQQDNTKVNKRDRSSAEDTADQQKMNAGDTELTQKIRQSIMGDKSLSTYAQNIKIISQDGQVTLKGPVKSEQEKESIVAMAVAATGNSAKVTDQISVKK